MHTAIAAPGRVPAGATETGDGVVVGSGQVAVDAYIDFLCPYCRMFEEQSGGALDAMVADRAISLIYHPVGFLDRLSTTRYSTRASASSGCAADGGRFAPYAEALFANQPREGGPGLSDDELIAIGATVGLPAPEFAGCVRSRAYVPWSEYVTERAIRRGVHGTPTVFVGGRPVPAHATAIAAAVAAAEGS
jgi:protein-disulfide isomerase